MVCQNIQVLIFQYAIVLAVAFILQFCAAAAALIYYGWAFDWNADALSFKMKNKYHLQDDDITHAIDELQKHYKCCGAWDYHDWQHSGFENNSKSFANENSDKPSIVPNSCCIGPHADCGKIIHPSNIYYKVIDRSIMFWFSFTSVVAFEVKFSSIYECADRSASSCLIWILYFALLYYIWLYLKNLFPSSKYFTLNPFYYLVQAFTVCVYFKVVMTV